MPRAKVSSEGKSPSASQDRSGATSANRMSEFHAIMTKKFEEVNMKFEKINKQLEDRDKRIEDLREEQKLGKILDEWKKEALNIDQRHVGLQHEAHQPRLAVEADVKEDNKTRESVEDFAQDGILGDISSNRVHDPMRLTSLGDQDCTDPPALPSRDDALVNQGHKVAKPCLSLVEIRKSTSADSLQRAGATSNTTTQGIYFPPQLLPRSFLETS